MRFVVRALDRIPIRRLDEAKRGTAHFIEPVGEKLDVVFILQRQILLVRIRDGMSSRAFDVVAIHVHWHIRSLSLGARAAQAWQIFECDDFHE